MVATLIGALRLRFIWYYLALSLTHLLNIGIVYERFYSGPGFELIDESLVVRAIAAVNVAALAVAFYALATQGSDRISAQSSSSSSAL